MSAIRGLFGANRSGSTGRAKVRYAGLIGVMAVMVLGISGALAVHQQSVFELDRDAVDNITTGLSSGEDWSLLDDGSGDPLDDDGALASAFVADSAVPDRIFTGGGSKDHLDINQWRQTTGSVPDKDQITDAFAAAYSCPDQPDTNGGDADAAPDLCLYFGLDRFAQNGSAQVGFWFFKETITPNANGTFNGGPHSDGDILVLSDFTNGGVVSTIKVYKWVGAGGDTNNTLDLVEIGAVCTIAIDPGACALANTVPISAPWPYTPKAGSSGTIPTGGFFEGGLNLDTLEIDLGCGGSFLAETRSSPSITATLKDFALGAFALCSANIQVGPDGVNRVGDDHTVTGHVNVVQNGVSSNAPAGTVINFTKVSGPGTLSATSCPTIGTTGSCTVTLTSSAAGQTVIRATSSPSISGTTFAVATDGTAPNSDDLQKTWVDARIGIDPDDVNRVGDSHTFTVTVEANTGSTWAAVNVDTAVTVGLVGDADSVVSTCANGTGDAGDSEGVGQCFVTFTSDTPGTVTGSASATVALSTTQGNIDVAVSTADANSLTGSAIKRFVDARIGIDPDDVNRVGDSHTFTVTVEANTGSTWAAVNVDTAVTVGLVGDADSVVSTCANGTGDAGDSEGVGQCFVTFTSDTPGTVTGSASATVALSTTQGNIDVAVSTADANSLTGSAIKRFVDARIGIDPDDVNRVGDSHTFTVTVEANTGSTWAAVNVDTAVTVGLVGDADSVVSTCANGTGDAGDSEGVGQCFVTFTSDTPGTVTGSASATVALSTTQGNIDVAVSTADANSLTGSAIKRFVDARIGIDPDDVNRVGDSHTFTVTVEANTGSTWAAVNVDTAVTVGLVGDADSVVSTCANGTGDAGDSEGVGQCFVTFTSDTPGTVTGSASATVALSTTQGNIDVAVSTADANSLTGSAIKRFVDARIGIDPDDVNRVGDSHTFTVTVEANTGSTWAAVNVDTAVTVGLVGDADSVVSTCANGTGDAGDSEGVGQCFVTFTSDTPGTVTGSASATVALSTTQGNIDVAVSTADANSLTGSAIKRFVDARIGIDPDDVNRVGDSHTFTVTVEANTGSTWAAVNVDTAVTVGLVGDADSVVSTCANGTGDAGDSEGVGQCFVTFTSDTPGTVTGSASATVALSTTQGNIDVAVSTADANSLTGSAIKRFVDARIGIDPDDVNRVGDSHTFTVTVEANTGSTWAAVNVDTAVTVGLVGDADSVVSTCANGTGDAGDSEGVGQCFVTFTSDTPGTVTGSASATVALSTTQGNIDVAVSTADANSLTGSAIKRFVDARIGIDPDDVNGITESHTFTVTVEANTGSTWAAVNVDTAVTVGLVGDADSVVSTCANGTGDAGDSEGVGQCFVTFTSDTPGTVTGSASATVALSTTQGNIDVAVSTADANSLTGSAIKRFVDGSLTWLKHDNNGQPLGGATFEVCRTHDRFGAAVSDACMTIVDDVDGTDDTTDDWDGTPGEFKLDGLLLGRYTIRETVAPGTYTLDAKVETIELTLENPDQAAATPWVNTPGGEGCTPGYWKNHTEAWDAFSDPAVDAMPAGYEFITTTSFNDYFNLTSTESGVADSFTMLQAVSASGGGVNKLMRHGVSALLNVNSVNYPISDFIGLYDDLRAAFLAGVYEPLATDLAAFNNLSHQNCPE